MRNSKKWKNWVTLHDEKTCTPCKQNNGKIYEINEVVNPSPPLHKNCRCKIELLKSIFAGEATNKKQDGADWYLKYKGKLPEYYIDRKTATKLGWISWMGNLSKVATDCMLFGGEYLNTNKKLPHQDGRIWYELDINYTSGYRNKQRILYSNDGLMFVTYDHYETFIEIR